MKYLGIDFGLKNLGLAIAESPLAEPFGQHYYQSDTQALNWIMRIIQEQEIDTIIIGLPEGALAKKIKSFGQSLRELSNLPVYYQDETLSTHQAKQKMISAHAPQKKRRLDHAPAAAVILQAYLDDHPQA